jgi:hypothetical protein
MILAEVTYMEDTYIQEEENQCLKEESVTMLTPKKSLICKESYKESPAVDDVTYNFAELSAKKVAS